MKRALFEQLLAARADKRPVVLVTALQSGEQALVFGEGEGEGDGEGKGNSDLGLAGEVLDAARDALRTGRSRMLDADPAGATFLHVFDPPLRLFVIGAVHIAQALAPMADMLGYGVTVIDPRGAFASIQRFSGLRVLDAWPDEGLQGEHFAVEPGRVFAHEFLHADFKAIEIPRTFGLVDRVLHGIRPCDVGDVSAARATAEVAVASFEQNKDCQHRADEPPRQ